MVRLPRRRLISALGIATQDLTPLYQRQNARQQQDGQAKASPTQNTAAPTGTISDITTQPMSNTHVPNRVPFAPLHPVIATGRRSKHRTNAPTTETAKATPKRQFLAPSRSSSVPTQSVGPVPLHARTTPISVPTPQPAVKTPQIQPPPAPLPKPVIPSPYLSDSSSC
jgi:hypothetical protein